MMHEHRLTAQLVVVTVGLLLASCGESTDEAYQRGYDDGLYDGWANTCNEIGQFSRTVADTLEKERIC